MVLYYQTSRNPIPNQAVLTNVLFFATSLTFGTFKSPFILLLVTVIYITDII